METAPQHGLLAPPIPAQPIHAPAAQLPLAPATGPGRTTPTASATLMLLRAAQVVMVPQQPPQQQHPGPAPASAAAARHQAVLQPQLVMHDAALTALPRLGSREVARFLKELSAEDGRGLEGRGRGRGRGRGQPEGGGQAVRAAALFNTLRAQPAGSLLRQLCDVFTYTAMVAQCQVMRGAG